MNKCLVTKLNASVDNPNLPIFGAIEFAVKVDNRDNNRLNIATLKNDGYIEIPSKYAYFVKPETGENLGYKVNLSKNKVSNINVKTDNVAEYINIRIVSKYDLAYISCPELNITCPKINFDDLKYSPISVIETHQGRFYGNMESIYSDKLTALVLHDATTVSDQTLIGNFDTLCEKCPNLGTINLAAENLQGITGNITSYAKLSKYCRTDFCGALYIRGTGITGNANALFDELAVRTMAEVTTIIMGNGKVTLNGAVLPNGELKTIKFLGNGNWEVIS